MNQREETVMQDHELKAKLTLDTEYIENVIRAADDLVAALGKLRGALRVEALPSAQSADGPV